MTFERQSGILLHPTSLPGPHGIGDFGSSTFRFIDWLEQAGQHLWQVMPLGPTGFGDSPYSSPSAFAGNPLLISLDWFKHHGLLGDQDLRSDGFPESTVDYGNVAPFKMDRLRAAFERLDAGDVPDVAEDFAAWLPSTDAWLPDFALFTALKIHFGGGWWLDWPEDLRNREPDAMDHWKQELAREVRFHSFVQYVFRKQWAKVRDYANGKGIQVIGDIPIFVALDSADVWSHRDQFQFGADGFPTFVTGVPPDYFSKTGQRWGNPTYDWVAMKANGYQWWVDRMRATQELVDIIRIDHFRGFTAAWHVPNADDTAANGHWELAPGGEVFAAVRRELGAVPIIVEDLGLITPDVVSLRAVLGFPGMNVLHFAFDGDPENAYLPHNYQRNSVVYTATHDNQTSIGWWSGLGEPERDEVRHYLGHAAEDIAWDLLRIAWASVSDVAIAPMQDVLRLGDEARMNTPATATGNWAWRLSGDQLDDGLADGLRDLTRTYGRDPKYTPATGANPFDYTEPSSGVRAIQRW